MEAPGVEPVLNPHRGTEKHIVIEVEIALGQAGDVVNPRLDVPRVKSGQRCLGHQITVVHQRQAVGWPQPIGRLRIGHDVDMAVVGEKLFQRTQAVAQFMVVPKAPFHIAVAGHGGTGIRGELLQGRLALGTPVRIVPVNPQINDVDGRIVGHVCVGFFEVAESSSGSARAFSIPALV